MGNWNPITVDIAGAREFDPTLFGQDETRGGYPMDIVSTEIHEKEGGKKSLQVDMRHGSDSPYTGKPRRMYLGLDLTKDGNKNKLFTFLASTGAPMAALQQGKVTISPSTFEGKKCFVFIEPQTNADGSPVVDDQGRRAFPDVSPLSAEAFKALKVTSKPGTAAAAVSTTAAPATGAAPANGAAPAVSSSLGALAGAAGAVSL